MSDPGISKPMAAELRKASVSRRTVNIWVPVSSSALAAILVFSSIMLAPREQEIASYATSLRGRKPAQVHNARLAVAAINNTVVPPNGEFSFHKTVGPWTTERGYVEAPVSYDGELIRDLGGGVCQASSTLYNAALMAGLEILERHRHHWPARYAPLGRDAAVAYPEVDLRFRNNLKRSVRIVGRIDGDLLVFTILSSARPPFSVRVDTEVRSVSVPAVVVQKLDRRGFRQAGLARQGCPGFYVVTYRRFVCGNKSRVEIVSQDYYPPFHRIVRVCGN